MSDDLPSAPRELLHDLRNSLFVIRSGVHLLPTMSDAARDEMLEAMRAAERRASAAAERLAESLFED